MIRHFCMFKLKDENKAANLEEFLTRAQSLRSIPQVCGFEVVSNGKGMPESNYDVALIFDFKTAEDLQAYQDNPIHRVFGAFVGQVRKERACIDYFINE